MSEAWEAWWGVGSSYRPSDFLMFSPRVYWRLFELANAASWPLQPAVLTAGALWCVLAVRATDAGRRRVLARAALLAIAAAWGWVGYAFVHRLYAAVNWGAAPFALAFAAQALAMSALALAASGIDLHANGPRRRAGLALLAWALVGQPLLGALAGRPSAQWEVIGVAPDPTLVATFGMLTWLQAPSAPAAGAGHAPWTLRALRALWAVPLVAASGSAATLATMGSLQALVLPAAIGVAAWAMWSARAGRTAAPARHTGDR